MMYKLIIRLFGRHPAQLEAVAGEVRMPDHVVLLVVVPEDEHPVPELGSTRFDPRDHVGGIRRVIIIRNSGLP